MFKKYLLTGLTAGILGLSSLVYASESTIMLEDSTGNSSFTIIDSNGEHIARFSGDGNVIIGGADSSDRLEIKGNVKILGAGNGVTFPDGTTQTTASSAGGGFGMVPIGSVIAWHKNLNGVPTLPEGWVECNGQVISDPESPLINNKTPDLNNTGRFLRGSSNSGTMQEDAFQGHRHWIDPEHGTGQNMPSAEGGSWSLANGTWYPANWTDTGEPKTDTINGTPRTATETRPVNMTVVWIMRVK